MWTTFWPDLLVALVGAVLTVVIAAATYLANRRLGETRAINALIREIHGRRVLTVGKPRVIRGAAKLDDYRWAAASVLSLRDEVRRTRDQVREMAKLQEPLSRMARACNRFLEESAYDPDTYAILAADLRDALTAEVHALSLARRGVRVLSPGEGAY